MTSLVYHITKYLAVSAGALPQIFLLYSILIRSLYFFANLNSSAVSFVPWHGYQTTLRTELNTHGREGTNVPRLIIDFVILQGDDLSLFVSDIH